MVPVRPDGESLSRELTVGVLSYADLVQRVHAVTSRLFARRLRRVELLVVDPDQRSVLLIFRVSAGAEARSEQISRSLRRLEPLCVELEEPLLLGENQATDLRERGIEPPKGEAPTLLLLPVRRGDERLGGLILAFDSMEGTEITRRWSTLGTLTKVIASTLGSCHEHERTVAERRELERIARAGSRLQILSSSEETCRRATQLMVKEFGFDRALMLVPNEDGTRLVGLCGEGYEDVAPLIHVSVESPTDVLAAVFRTGSPFMSHGSPDDLRVPVIMREAGPIHDAIALPLRLADESLGVLWGDHTQSGAWMPSHRTTLLALFASQVAAALNSSHMLRRIEQLAETDPLTGLANRRHLENLLRQEIPRVKRRNTNLSLMMVDIDQFKRLNDDYGHEYGDRVLQDVASLIRTTVRQADIVARFGGDEFVVLMPETNEAQAGIARERVEAAVRTYNASLPPTRPPMSLSIGVRTAGPESVDTLLLEADRSMYVAKEETVRVQLLEALLADSGREVARWDHFIANSLKVLYEKEPGYFDHSRRVMQMALTLARQVGLNEGECVVLGLAALLHDLGKISIPSSFLTRAGPLATDEYAVVQTHCELGEEMLRGTSYLGPVRILIRAHHERFDGSREGRYPGYPDGLAGESIPIGARILKIADAYDAITAGRCYQAPRPPLEALEILRQESGRAFDPALVDSFVQYMKPNLVDDTPAIPEDLAREAQEKTENRNGD